MLRIDGERLERARASAQFQDGRFRNTSGVGVRPSGPSAGIIGEFFFGGRARRPRSLLPIERPHEAWADPIDRGDLRVTWLGHSSMLVESNGLRVLTDPVFGDRASPVSFAGPKRFHDVPATVVELPRLDAVLLSHDHYDHLCRVTMQEIAKLRVPVVTSLGVGARLESFGVDPACIVELDWWETATLAGGELALTAAPAQHFSGRSVGDRNLTLWSSWRIQTARHKVFFSGDTGLTDEFVAIGRRLGPFDLTMLEIGAFHPAWGTIHLGPDNALEAFRMLGGGTLLPVHWGTFDLGLHPWDEPAETLLTQAAARRARIITPALGRPVVTSRLEGPTPWWRGQGQAQGRGVSGQAADPTRRDLASV